MPQILNFVLRSIGQVLFNVALEIIFDILLDKLKGNVRNAFGFINCIIPTYTKTRAHPDALTKPRAGGSTHTHIFYYNA